MIPFNNWKTFIKREQEKGYLNETFEKVMRDRENTEVYPSVEDTFKALFFTQPYDIRVVIIGDEPYCEPGLADGLAFSVKDGNMPPTLLRIIFKELALEYGIEKPRTNGNLTDWTMQGVLLLNTILTVRKNQPFSHQNIGWERFTKEVIRYINTLDQPIVFMLWGSNVQNMMMYLDNPKHKIMMTVEPNPLTADKGFYGCGHFRRANEFLVQNGQSPIKWM